ncbi:MAG: tetratricopeptide repeat protein [Anaerolineae bacterium]|nr:tetratricopeptide repeat protein [Anaerolineae bacterium]MBT7991281.1 tetratricopeptide repeat protein [Anaerolineae bacterium]
MKKSKFIAGSFILVGIALVVGAIYFLLTPNASEESGSLLKTIGELIAFFLGAGTSVKGWKDLFAPEKPSAPTTNIESSGDIAQINTEEHGKNIQTETYIEQVENYHEAPSKPFSPLFSIPSPPLDFTGRDEELEAIKTELSRGGTAAISGLSGMGGVGKTVLGLKAAQDLRDIFPDVQIYVEMKGTTEPIAPEDAMREIILAFDPTVDLRTTSPAQLTAFYRSFLQDKKALLFFDNALNAMQVKPLIEGIPCAALVTSRRHFALPGLLPTRLDVMSPEDSKNLLLELSPRIGKDADKLTQLCGYLPLALRIAGNFLAMNESWTVTEYIETLSDERTRLKELKSPDDPDLDVEATIQLSYDQLDTETQSHWRKLGVFPAPFDRQAAKATLGLAENKTRTLLGLLRRFSLIFFEEEQGKYHLHDLLRDFALKELSEEENFSARLNHADYFKELASYANQLYLQGGEKILKGLAFFDTHWVHIQAGQAWAVRQKENKAAQELATLYPNSAAHLIDLRLHPRVSINWLKSALEAAKFLEKKDMQGVHLGNLGLDYSNLGDTKKAIEYYEQALDISREIGDKYNEGNWLGNLGIVYDTLRDPKKAIEYYEQALDISREIGNRHGEGADLGNLGISYKNLGDAKKAIEYYEQALDISREIGDKYNEGNMLGNLGVAYMELGDAKKAITFYKEQLVIVREIGNRRGEGNALANMGQAYKTLDDPAKAKKLWRQAIVIFKAIESPSAEVVQGELDELNKSE